LVVEGKIIYRFFKVVDMRDRLVFGKESKKERLAFQIVGGLLLAFLWLFTLLGVLEFTIPLFVFLLVFTAVYLLSLLVKARHKGVATDTDSKTSPDRYGKSY